MFDRVFSPSKNNPQRVRERVADEDIRLRFLEDLADFFQANGGVEDDGDDSKFEQGEGEREELDAGRSHYSGGHVWGQRAGLKSKKEAVELLKSEEAAIEAVRSELSKAAGWAASKSDILRAGVRLFAEQRLEQMKELLAELGSVAKGKKKG